jgi:hypothetical protein
MRISGVLVRVSYDIPELCSRLGVAFIAIHEMHQPSMNPKTFNAIHEIHQPSMNSKTFNAIRGMHQPSMNPKIFNAIHEIFIVIASPHISFFILDEA